MSTALSHPFGTGTENNECLTIVARRCLKANVSAGRYKPKLPWFIITIKGPTLGLFSPLFTCRGINTFTLSLKMKTEIQYAIAAQFLRKKECVHRKNIKLFMV